MNEALEDSQRDGWDAGSTLNAGRRDEQRLSAGEVWAEVQLSTTKQPRWKLRTFISSNLINDFIPIDS